MRKDGEYLRFDATNPARPVVLASGVMEGTVKSADGSPAAGVVVRVAEFVGKISL